MYWASASLAWNLPGSQSSEAWRLSAVASHRRSSCSSSLASFLISSKFRWEGRLRDILTPHFVAPAPPLTGGRYPLIDWEANDEIPCERMLLVKRSVSERGIKVLDSFLPNL